MFFPGSFWFLIIKVPFFPFVLHTFLNLFDAYFVLQDEPGKQVRSAIKIKNSSKSHVAFKVPMISLFFFYTWALHSLLARLYSF